MLNRRNFMSQLCLGSTAVLLSGCGGGGGGSGGSTGGIVAPPVAGNPTPAPPATPTPSAVPTLKGVTIDSAEAEILNGMAAGRDWFAATRTPQSETVVRSADEFQTAVNAAFDTTVNAQVLALNHRIVLDWNGESMLAAGPAGRVTIGRKTLSQTHAESGGSLTIAAAPGRSPAFSNTVYITGKGIKLVGVGFTRRAAAGENGDVLSTVIIQQNSTFPVDSLVRFEGCKFGALNFDPSAPPSSFVSGVATLGSVMDYIAFSKCTFQGVQNGAKIVARGTEFDLCDFRNVLQDGIDLFGHTFSTGYYAHALVSRTTFRDWGDTWESRSQHSDAIQTGTAADKHLGYRVVVRDTVAHMARRYAGEPGKGGGTQGFYNDDHMTADNQFVVRRSTFLVSAPNGFTYHSPQASRPSFVDQSTFMRSGTVPSAFSPDATEQDFTVMVRANAVSNSDWLLVTDTIAKNGFTVVPATINIADVDPRAFGRAPDNQQPEKIFIGRDFGRGTAAANGIAGKFGYALSDERSTQARFVAEVWANFEPQAALAGKGAPDLRGLPWTA